MPRDSTTEVSEGEFAKSIGVSPEDLEKMYEYLDELRESGRTNMFGAASYLKERFPSLSTKASREVLVRWMESF